MMKFAAQQFIAAYQNVEIEPEKYVPPCIADVRNFLRHFGDVALLDLEFRYGLALAGGALPTVSVVMGMGTGLSPFQRLLWEAYGLSFGVIVGPQTESIRWESLEGEHSMRGSDLTNIAMGGPFPVFINQMNNPSRRTLDYQLDITMAHYLVEDNTALRQMIKARKPDMFLKYCGYLNGVQVDQTLVDVTPPRTFRRLINLED